MIAACFEFVYTHFIGGERKHKLKNCEQNNAFVAPNQRLIICGCSGVWNTKCCDFRGSARAQSMVGRKCLSLRQKIYKTYHKHKHIITSLYYVWGKSRATRARTREEYFWISSNAVWLCRVHFWEFGMRSGAVFCSPKGHQLVFV